MAIQLKKNQPIDLTKRGASKVHVGLSWDKVDGAEVDCDCSVVMLGANDKIPTDRFFVFYNNLSSEDGSVVHQGDNLDGAGDGDDEVIAVDLGKVRPDVLQMLFVVTIHDAVERGQNFGIVKNASIRILKDSTCLCEYTMSESAPDFDSIIIGRMVREGAEWNFEALSQGFEGGLAAVVGLYS